MSPIKTRRYRGLDTSFVLHSVLIGRQKHGLCVGPSGAVRLAPYDTTWKKNTVEGDMFLRTVGMGTL